jgi:hypothetical protein
MASSSPPALPPTPGIPSEKEICRYIAEMCSELRLLAKHSRLRTVNYLLDMARLEAERLGETLPD